MSPGAYFETIVITTLTVMTFITLLLILLYLYGREETTR